MAEDVALLVLTVNDAHERAISAEKLNVRSPRDGLAPSPTLPASRTPSPSLPEIPAADLDLTRSFDNILGTNASAEPHAERVQKRASNVLRLTQENEKLKEELKAMSVRLEAAERRRQEIANRQVQQTQQQPASRLVTNPARSQGGS